jgi:protein TonB
VFEHVEGIRKKDRRGTLPAAVTAGVVHVCLIALLIWGVRSQALLAIGPAGTGPDLNFPEGGGGGGGGSDGEMVSYVEVAPATPQPEPVVETVPEEDVLIPPEPTPVPEPPKQEAPKTDAPPTPPVPAPSGGQGGTGGGEGPGAGPGQGPGTGPGSGGGSGGGDGGGIGAGQGPGTGGGNRIRPPTSDVLFIPPDKPNGVASQEVRVRVTVDVRGRVREARLVNSTGNRGYDERIRRWALTLLWRPAVDTATNRPIEATTEVNFTV